MGNRWRFLYCTMTELWGRVRDAWARGWYARVQAQQGPGRQIPPGGPEGVMRTEMRVGKRAWRAPRKAAIVHSVPVPQTDTGG